MISIDEQKERQVWSRVMGTASCPPSEAAKQDGLTEKTLAQMIAGKEAGCTVRKTSGRYPGGCVMDYSFFIEYLKQKQYLTDLEKDILDTWNELQKNPFDRSAAQRQVLQNDAKYPEIFLAIAALPTTVSRPIERMTEFDIRYNLENQLAALAAKEGWQKYGQ